MNKKLSIAIACGITTMCVATNGYSAAHAKESNKSFNIGGDIEIDMTGTNTDPSNVELVGGRAKLNAVGMVTGNNGLFAKGVVQPIVKFSDGSLASDDVYFQFGKTNKWDLQLGRFEAMNLLPLGKDTLVTTLGVGGYNAGTFRGRQSNHAALHVGSADGFLFELGLVYEKNDKGKTSAFRPAVSFNAGAMKFHAGIESANANLSYASGGEDNAEASSIALNYTKGPWGVGFLRNEIDDSDLSENTLYGAYTMPLLGLKDASVTFAASATSADGLADDVDDSGSAARVRLNYTF